MGHRYLIAISTAALVIAAAPSLAQSQLPRPGQLPPAGGQAQPPQRGQAAQQQPKQPAPKPYKLVAVGAPAAVADPTFEAFRKKIGEAAERKDKRALAALVAQNFFWLGEKGDKADKRKPGIDNLAKAIDLDAKDGSGWETLGGYAADPTASPYPDRKDTICGPGQPKFNPQELEAVAKATGTDEGDWAFTTEAGIEVRSTAQPNSPVIEKLGMQFVWMMLDETPGNEDNPMIRIVAPSGKVGFVSGDTVTPLGGDEVCYGKDAGGWKIVGYIGDE